jgi:hypothetical protein
MFSPLAGNLLKELKFYVQVLTCLTFYTLFLFIMSVLFYNFTPQGPVFFVSKSSLGCAEAIFSLP